MYFHAICRLSSLPAYNVLSANLARSRLFFAVRKSPVNESLTAPGFLCSFALSTNMVNTETLTRTERKKREENVRREFLKKLNFLSG